MLGKVFHRMILFICIMCLILISSSPALAKSKKTRTLSNDQSITSIWEGEGEYVNILYYGVGGMFWSLENEDYDKEFYRYDGSSVEKITDLRGYEMERVEQDGIEVWVESLDADWNEFRMFYKMDGKKKVIKDSNYNFADQVQISYPYITWKERRFGMVTSYSFNVESEELSSNANYGALDKSFYKTDQQNRKEYVRTFEINDYEYGKYQDWETTGNYLAWNERSGIFLSDSQKESGVYKLTNQLEKNRLLGMDDDYTVWSNVNDQFGIYSNRDNQISIFPVDDKLQDISSSKVYNGNAAVAVEEDEKVQIYLVNLASMLANTDEQTKLVYKPQTIKPKYVDSIHGVLSDNVGILQASSEYLVWSEQSWMNELKYKKLNDPKTYLIPGSWDSAQLRGKTLYAFGNEGREDERGDWDYPYSLYGLYQIDLETGTLQRIIKVDEDSVYNLDTLVEQSGVFYWYDSDEEEFVRFDPDEEEPTSINLDVSYPAEFAVSGDTFVWIERDGYKRQIKMQTIGEKAVIVAQWSSKDKEADEIVFDGNRIVWNEWKKGLSKVNMYDLSTKKVQPIFSVKESRPARQLQITGDAVYFIGPKSKDSHLLHRYDLTSGKTIASGHNVDNFIVQGDKVYYSDEIHEDQYYLIGKKNTSTKDITLRYKWKDLSRNNQQKWYDIQYSFFSKDIHVTIGDDEYTWEELLDDPEEWNDAVRDHPDQISVTVSLK